MNVKVLELYKGLLEEAIDLTTIPKFSYYANMTTAHAQRKILDMLEDRTLYQFNGGLIVKMFDKLNFIRPNKTPSLPNGEGYPEWMNQLSIVEDPVPPTIRVSLGISPKHVVKGRYSSSELKRVSDGRILNDVVFGLVGI